MICPGCNGFVEIRAKGYQPKFCSRACANKRDHSNDTKARMAKASRINIAGETPEQRQSRISKSVMTQKANRALKMATGKFDSLSVYMKRERIDLEQNGKCALCPNDKTWNGKPLRFELDHVNGDRSNESRANLRLLCPNCHSQTETFCKPKTREVDLEQIKESSSLHVGMRNQGLQPSGRQYKRIKNMLR